MLLAIDVGNTNIVLGVFDGKNLVQNWRMETDKNKSADEYGMIINELFKFNGIDIREFSYVPLKASIVEDETTGLPYITTEYKEGVVAKWISYVYYKVIAEKKTDGSCRGIQYKGGDHGLYLKERHQGSVEHSADSSHQKPAQNTHEKRHSQLRGGGHSVARKQHTAEACAKAHHGPY